mgnify:CR=1 FL=1
MNFQFIEQKNTQIEDWAGKHRKIFYLLLWRGSVGHEIFISCFSRQKKPSFLKAGQFNSHLEGGEYLRELVDVRILILDCNQFFDTHQ